MGLARFVLVAAVAALAALVMGTSILAGSGADSSTPAALSSLLSVSESCQVSGPVPGLDPAQAHDAEVVVSVAMADSGESTRAAQIALMTAYTESGLHDLGPLPGSDSLGLFQQRASMGWGTPAEEQDPAEATAMFVQRLVQVPAWASLAPWVAAQDVQRSAFADGSNYERHWALAAGLLGQILGLANAPGGCGQGPPGGLAGPPQGHGLPAGYAIPPGTPPGHAAAVTFALAQLGKPYVWAGAGPNDWDCSGLTMVAWQQAGVFLTHYAPAQEEQGTPVAPAEAIAGDLVLIPGSDPPGPGQPGHVGIYLGYGLVLSAVDPQEGVVVQSWQSFVAGGLDAVVDPAPGR
jgi:hypothetical protein